MDAVGAWFIYTVNKSVNCYFLENICKLLFSREYQEDLNDDVTAKGWYQKMFSKKNKEINIIVDKTTY